MRNLMEAKRRRAAARGLELLQFSSFERRDRELKLHFQKTNSALRMVFESMRRLSWAWPHFAYMFLRHLKPWKAPSQGRNWISVKRRGGGHPPNFLMTDKNLLFGRQVAAAEEGVQQFCHCEVPGIGMFIRVARHTRKRWELHYHGGWRSKEHGFVISSFGNNGGSFLSPS